MCPSQGFKGHEPSSTLYGSLSTLKASMLIRYIILITRLSDKFKRNQVSRTVIVDRLPEAVAGGATGTGFGSLPKPCIREDTLDGATDVDASLS